MISYFAIHKNEVFSGGWQQCLQWANVRHENSGDAIQFVKARAGDKDARVIAEVSSGQLKAIPHGMRYRIRDLRMRLHG